MDRDRLRTAILASRMLEAQQEAADLLRRGEKDATLAALYAAAAQHFDTSTSTPHGLILVVQLERVLPEATRLGIAPQLAAHVAGTLALAPKTTLEPIPRAARPTSDRFASIVNDGDLAATHALLVAIAEGDAVVRTALVGIATANPGQLGHTLIFIDAFLHAVALCSRVAKESVPLLANSAARYLVARVKEPGVAAESWAEPPIPGDAAAGALLSGLRSFHIPSAIASLDALCRAQRIDEAMTVLWLRAAENAGRTWHNLAFADAVKELLPSVPAGDRRGLLLVLAQRLLRRVPGQPLVTGLLDDHPAKPASKREKEALDAKLADAIVRADLETALEASRALVADEEGADVVRRALFRAAIAAKDRHPPHLFIFVALACRLAQHVGWPAARGPILRAVHGVTAERND